MRGFDTFRSLYADDHDFCSILNSCDGGPLKETRLCIPVRSLREAIILESHAGGFAGHFGRDKTYSIVREQFY